MAKTLGSLQVGDEIKIKENGKDTPYIIAHRGLPNTEIYSGSFDGVWVVRKHLLPNAMDFGANNSTASVYLYSYINSYLNSQFINTIDQKIRKRIAQVEIPYSIFNESGRVDYYSCQVFVLSAYEFGAPRYMENPEWLPAKAEGAPLQLFRTNYTYRIASLDTSAQPMPHFTRTPVNGGFVFFVKESGALSSSAAWTARYVRPVFILPYDMYVDSNNNVTDNQPPTTPSSINLPSTVKGGASCSISWSAASDPDGNLEGYIVERSYNGGSSWAQIYQGSSTSAGTTIPHGTSTVMFRVCAYDTAGERSGWRTSSNKTVLNNRAPNAPPAINVPVTPSGGDPVTVTWSAATDPDGNLEGYRLERRWDGKGSWAQIYQGAGLSFTETIPKGEHTSVTYRVRAYDSFGDTSGYTTSPERSISNNTAPVIQCDLSGDLGDKSEGFTIPYTVTDAENQAVTVVEKVGGMVKRTYQVTLGQSNTFQVTGQYFQKILNGKQTAEIIATDAEGKSSTLSLTFVKKVHRAVIMLTEPLAVDKEITVCVIKVLGDIPEDAEFKVEVSNNAGDDAPAWEDATQDAKLGRNHIFTNKTQTNGWKFGFRVTAARGASDTAGNIVSIQGGFQ